MAYSIIIPTRNEDMTGFTVRRVLETTTDAEIIVVDDGSEPADRITRQLSEFGNTVRYERLPTAVGNCFARDRGIEMANHDCCIILDAHMNFWGPGWAEQMASHVRENPTDLTCTIYRTIYPENMEMDSKTACYYGCQFELCQRTSDGQNRVFQGIWAGNNAIKDAVRAGQVAEIPCIMGGAYSLSKRHYQTTLGRIWKYLRGWGCSEPIISAMNWFTGGRQVILPLEIGHMSRAGRFHVVPYRTLLWKYVYNQALAAMTFCPPAVSAKMLDHLRRNVYRAEVEDGIRQAEGPAAELREHLERHRVRQWPEFLKLCKDGEKA